MSKNIGVAAVGDVLDINCWSNIPYYFFKAGSEHGLFNQPWSLDLKRADLLRYGWNLKQILLGKGKGGFQYSDLFLRFAESRIPKSYFSSTVISFNQTFPRAASVTKQGGRIFYYIDTTLHDLFNEPGYGIQIPQAMKELALEQEKHNYAAAAGVITMGTWSQASLMDYYQLPLYKIHQILPGANIILPPSFTPVDLGPGAGVTRDLVLGFVGKDWKRKGLSLLIDVKDELVRRGYRVSIKAIGSTPPELAGKENVVFTGFIDKQQDANKFIAEIASCDIGCLLSSTEALGISTLEFIRTGVPVLGFYHQGLKDTLLENASIRIPLHSGVTEIADRISYFIQHPEALSHLRENAVRLSPTVTWDQTIHQFKELL